MEMSQMHTDHERRISHIEGKLESLATKELVLQLNANLLVQINEKFDTINDKFDAINDKFDGINDKFDGINDKFDGKFDGINDKFDGINNKIDDQTKELRAEIKNLDERINTKTRKYTKLAGAAIAIGLILSLVVGAANAFATAVSAGLLQIG